MEFIEHDIKHGVIALSLKSVFVVKQCHALFFHGLTIFQQSS